MAQGPGLFESCRAMLLLGGPAGHSTETTLLKPEGLVEFAMLFLDSPGHPSPLSSF